MGVELTKEFENVISPDGLRYKFKQPGSSNFPVESAYKRSCYVCGSRRVSTEGSYKKFVGKMQFCCIDCTKPKNENS